MATDYPRSLQVHDETQIICEGAESLLLTGTFTNWELADAQRGWYSLVESDNLYHWVKFVTAVPTDNGWEFMWARQYSTRKLHQNLKPFVQECRANYLEYTGRVYVRATIRSQFGSCAVQVFPMQRESLKGTNPTESVRQGFSNWLLGQPCSQGWTLLTWELIPEEAATDWWLRQPDFVAA